MTNKERLEQVLNLFVERFGLRPPYDSEGARAIEEAIASKHPDIDGLRRLLTEDYNLYPQYEPQVLALLDAIKEEAAAVSVSRPAETDTAVTQEAEPSPKKAPVKSARRKAK